MDHQGRMYIHLPQAGSPPGILTVPGPRPGRIDLVHATWGDRAPAYGQRTTHVHEVFHVVLVHAGQGSFPWRDEIIGVHAPWLILTSPGEPHAFARAHGDTTVYSEVTFTLSGGPAKAHSWPGLLSAWTGTPVTIQTQGAIDPGLAREVEQVTADLVSTAFRQPPNLEVQIQGLLARLLFVLWRGLAPGVVDSGDHLDAARRFLEASGGELRSLDEVANAVGIHRKRLIRGFRQRYGLAPMAWHRQQLLERACLLLDSTALPVQAVAERLGFADAHYFNRVFTKTLGVPPGKWRKRSAPG